MSDYKQRIKQELIEVYGNKCFMNELWIPNKKNILTFHHILEDRYGGKYVFENGALVSHERHVYLNYLDRKYHKVYKEINGAFEDLKKTYAPPTEEYYKEIKMILRRCR